MAVSRIHYVLLAVAVILLLSGVAHQHDQVRNAVQKAWQGNHSNDGSGGSQLSFHEIALKYGTDKVTHHHYWYLYEKYFDSLRSKNLKMLEIGLGCDMTYGPGKSYYTWLEFFPHVDLFYIEYDAECANKWAHKTSGATVFPGDQANETFLQEFIDEAGTDFDIIIDDGGHSMNQQITSIEYLWKIVKPGGIYVCEDLETSFMTTDQNYGGDPTGKDPNIHTMMKFIYELIDDKMTDGARRAISADMRSIECQRQVCAFTKKETGAI